MGDASRAPKRDGCGGRGRSSLPVSALSLGVLMAQHVSSRACDAGSGVNSLSGSICPLRVLCRRLRKKMSPACRWQGGQRRTNISFARSGSGALVSAGFSTLASLVCPARNSFLSLFTRNETGDPFPGRLSGQKSARTVSDGLIR